MKSLPEDINEKFYFCPYCRTVSYEDDLFYKKENGKFKCLDPDCKKSFSAKAYNGEAVTNGGKAYKLMENSDNSDDVEQAIILFINELYWEGYTHREIQKITRFSLEVIRKAMKYIYEMEADTKGEEENLTKKQFLQRKLDVSETDWTTFKNRKNNVAIEEWKNLERTVINAYNFGCTYADIEKLLRVSSKSISLMINGNEDSINLICEHKVIVEANHVEIIMKRRRRKKRKISTE